MLRAMDEIDPPVQLNDPAAEASKTWILENTTQTDSDYPQVRLLSNILFWHQWSLQAFYDHATRCWSDRGVQATFERSNEFQLIGECLQDVESDG